MALFCTSRCGHQPESPPVAVLCERKQKLTSCPTFLNGSGAGELACCHLHLRDVVDREQKAQTQAALQTQQESVKIFTPQCCNRSLSKSSHHSAATGVCQTLHTTVLQQESVKIFTPQCCKHKRSLSKSSHHSAATGVSKSLHHSPANTSLSKSSHHSDARQHKSVKILTIQCCKHNTSLSKFFPPYHCKLNTQNHHTIVLQTKQVSVKIFTPQCCKHKSVKILIPQCCKNNRHLSKSSYHSPANATGVCQNVHTTVLQMQQESVKITTPYHCKHNRSLSKSSNHLICLKPCHCQENVDKSFEK